MHAAPGKPPLRLGIGGPVGSGKTALTLALCRRLRDTHSVAVVTNDIYTVFIDGDSIGTLQKRGARTLTGFRVDEGEHTVLVGMDGCPGEVARVTTGFGAGVVMLMADVEERMSGLESACRVVLRP